MFVPVGQRVITQAAGYVQDLEPQLVQPFFFRQLRIQQLRPYGAGYGGHQPVGPGSHHAVGILLHGLVERFLPGKNLLPVDALHAAGVGGNQAQEGRTLPVVIQVELAAPAGNSLEFVLGFILVAQPGGGVAVPVEYHLGGTDLVGFLCQQGGERVGFHRGVDHQDLVLLQVDAFL